MCSGSENIACRSSRSSGRYGRRRRRSVSSRKSSSTATVRSGFAGASTILGWAPTRSVDGHQGQAAPPPVLDVLGVERGKYLFGDVADAGHSAFCIGVYPLTTDKEILDISRQQFDVGLPDVEAFIDRDTCGRAGRRTRSSASPTSSSRQRPRRRPAGCFAWPWNRGARWAWSRCSRSSPSSTCSNPGPRAGGSPSTCRRTASTARGVRRPERHGRRDGPGGPAVRVPGSRVGQRVRHRRVRGQPPVQGGDPGGRRMLPVPPARQGDRDQAGQARHVHGRPFNDRGGSGLHLNISFRREDGSNALHDPNAPDGLAPMVKECGRLLAHHEGIAAIAAPHANAYKRLQPDMLNGYWANWGYDDGRSASASPRPRGGHAHRTPDGRRRREPVPGRRGGAARRAVRGGASDVAPEPQKPGEPPNTERRVPPTLEAALAAFEADDELSAARRGSSRPSRSSSEPSGSATPRPSATRRRPRSPRGARLLPAVLLTAPAGVVPAGRSVPNYPASPEEAPMSVRLDEIDLSSHDAFVDEVPLWAFRELRERDRSTGSPSRRPTAGSGRSRGSTTSRTSCATRGRSLGPRGDARGADRGRGRGAGVDDRHGSAEPLATPATRHEALHAERGRPVRGVRPGTGPARAGPRSVQGRVRLRRGDLAEPRSASSPGSWASRTRICRCASSSATR